MRLLSVLMAFSGILILALSLIPTFSICREDKRKGWRALLLLILFFIVGFAAYIGMLMRTAFSPIELVVSLILFAGSCFVLLVTRLSLKTIEDINQIAAQERHNALHDPLTGLPNRKYLFGTLNYTVARAQRKQRSFAVLMIDLDRFKEVNDVLGHHIGDKLLQKITPRLAAAINDKNQFRVRGTLARLGGDEFALVLPYADQKQAIKSAKHFSEVLKEPFLINNHQLTIEMSIGIAMYPEDGDTPDLLLQRADIAMYAAKRQHLPYMIYDQSLDQHSLRRLTITAKLQQAIEEEAFELYYQPVIGARQQYVQTMETLIRWPQADNQFISPSEFIPIAEQSDAIQRITEWVIRTALVQLKQWHQKGWPLRLQINLSSRDIQNPKLPEKITALLQEADIQASDIGFEITESAMMTNIDAATRVIKAINELGIAISIDDFGTGFSSLSLLRTLPIRQIKIGNKRVGAINVRKKHHGFTVFFAQNEQFGLFFIGIGERVYLHVVSLLQWFFKNRDSVASLGLSPEDPNILQLIRFSDMGVVQQSDKK